MTSSSPAKNPDAGSTEFGGSFSITTNWLRFGGPCTPTTEVVDVELVVLVVGEEVVGVDWVVGVDGWLVLLKAITAATTMIITMTTMPTAAPLLIPRLLRVNIV